MRLLLEGGCFLSGLLAGSLLEVVIERVPTKQSLARPWFTCSQCSSELVPIVRVLPVVWWIASRGRCKSCGERFSVRRLGVEITTGALFSLSAIRFGADLVLLAYCIFAGLLVAATVVDARMRIVPVRFVYPTLVATLVVLPLASVLDHSSSSLVHAAIGGASAFGFFFLVHFIYPDGLGFGDVRLAFLIGVYLGWLGEAYVFVGLALSFVFAAVAGLWLVIFRGQGRKSSVPLVPFLAAGSLITVFWGAPITRFWLGIHG
ncbi:MAG: prepilin peptidase [Acidimicrobiales bacterium]